MNEPALDNEDMRKANAKRVSDGIHHVGEFFKEYKELNKKNVVMNIVFMVLIFGTIIGAIVYSYVKTGDAAGSFWDTSMLSRRIECSSGGARDTVRSYQDAKMFIELFGGNCTLARSVMMHGPG